MSDKKGVSTCSGNTLQMGVLLALVGGFLDVYTYLFRGGVFANAQTGNFVLLGIAAANGKIRSVGYYLIPITAFFIGILVTEWMKHHFTGVKYIGWEHLVLILEIVLLFFIGFLPDTVPDAAVNVTISFICSMQVNSFRVMKDISYATTMCTGNLRSSAASFYAWMAGLDKKAGKKCFHYIIIIVSFCAGAIFGAVFTALWKERAVWCCCILLMLVLGDRRLQRNAR